jgi:hypothetical protein
MLLIIFVYTESTFVKLECGRRKAESQPICAYTLKDFFSMIGFDLIPKGGRG